MSFPLDIENLILDFYTPTPEYDVFIRSIKKMRSEWTKNGDHTEISHTEKITHDYWDQIYGAVVLYDGEVVYNMNVYYGGPGRIISSTRRPSILTKIVKGADGKWYFSPRSMHQ